MKRFAAAAFGLVLAAVVGVASSGAQPKAEGGRAAIVQKLVDCRKLTEDGARLACYDQATAALDQAEAKGDIVVVDREQARKVRRQAFGFSLPSITLFEKGETKEDLENVSGVVMAARQDNMGHWIIKLEDGATWAQIDATELFKTPKQGMPVKIRKASLGSFLMTVDNQRAFRAKRTD